MRTLALLLLAAFPSCSNDKDGDDTGNYEEAEPLDYSDFGPYGVGHTRVSLADPDGGDRELRVEIWYPSDVAEGPEAMPQAYNEGDEAALYGELLLDAPEDCPSTESQAERDAEPAEGDRHVVLFSHCHECTRFSSFTVAEHLASHGIVVLAPDHAGNTLFDQLAGEPLPLNKDTLELRREDMVRVLDALDDGQLGDFMPTPTGKIATLGHSFGSVTAGYVAQTDDRIMAAFGLAAPMENPLLPGVEMDDFDKPLGLLVAQEDNSISEVGNDLIRTNAADAQGPTWLVEMEDAGHWSVSDIVGLTEDFMPGCGSDERQDGSETFDYPDPATARMATAAIVTAFMAEQLAGHEGSLEAQALDGVEILPQ